MANGGLGNGVSRKELSAALKEMGELETLVMQPHKPYAFVTYRCRIQSAPISPGWFTLCNILLTSIWRFCSRSEDCAQKAHIQLSGENIPCGESSVTLYLSFVSSGRCCRLGSNTCRRKSPILSMYIQLCLCVCAVPCEEEASVPLPQGLVLVEDFVSLEEEAQLLAAVDWSSGNDDVTGKIFPFFCV